MANNKLKVLSLAVLLSLTLSLIFPAGVLADDNQPPASDAPEVTTPPEETSLDEGSAVETVVPESLDEVLSPVDEAAPADSSVVDVMAEEAPADSESTVEDVPLLAQLPESTDAVVLNESGSPVPLASQEAAAIMQEADPMWCPMTATTVTSDCVNHATVTGLLALLAGENADGVIYFMPTYGTNDATFDGTNVNLVGLSDNALTIQGGWNGNTTLNSTISFAGSSAFSVPLVIRNWTGNIFVNDITISNISSTASLTVSTTGDITLDNVDVINQTTSGFLTPARNTALLTSTSGDITVQNGSSFDGSGRNRGFSATTTSGSIYIADTTFQEASGGLLADYNGATLSAPTITLTNVTARNNDLNGIAITNANTVTLNNVTATNNGTLFWGSGVKISGTGAKVLVNSGAFTNNKGYGIELTGTGNRLFVQTPPTSCSGNIWGCYNVSAIPVVLGCTDPTAFNYNPSANTDDGSCEPVVLGCTDETAFNYSSEANTDDGSCEAVVLGCTDPTAFNYNSAANTDDGTCVPVESSIPSRSTGTTASFIPVTGSGIALSCTAPFTTVENMAGFEVTFTSLCGYSATLTEGTENIVSDLPDGNKLVGGINISLLKDGSSVEMLPAGAAIKLSFEIPSGMTGDTLSILFWDSTAAAWVEQSVTVADGKVVLTGAMPGTFVLVEK